MQRSHISGDWGHGERFYAVRHHASCDVCKTLKHKSWMPTLWCRVATGRFYNASEAPLWDVFGPFARDRWSLGQGPMLQRYNKWCFDSYLLSVRASLMTDGSNWPSTIGKHLQRSEMKPLDFGRHRAYKCYIVVVPRPTREFATIGRVLTSAQVHLFQLQSIKRHGIILDCSPNVSACVLHAKVMVQWYLETECFRQPDPASVSQDLEPFEGVQSHVLYADSPVLFLAHANRRHHLYIVF